MFIHPDIALQFAAERRQEDERRARLRNRPLPDRRTVRAERPR
ncbi:MAG TPA: hypothetical protein VHQ96_08920 [Gaiellaceae bacterium]|jgi:hypothetical protein|nr:hypothetical protein [Gaiellaceae bacterium]